MPKKRVLVILNECYPYDKGEAFLENEIPLINGFASIYICPCLVQDLSKARPVNHDTAEIIPVKKDPSFMGKAAKLFRYIKCLLSPPAWQELAYLKRDKRLNLRTVKRLLSFLSAAELSMKLIQEKLKERLEKPENIELVFYSYWMSFQAYAAVRLKRKYPNSKAVSRCHRFDLYENRNADQYIPMRKYILENLNTVFSISNDGKRYIEERYKGINKNVVVSRLGTNDYGASLDSFERTPLKIISCSRVVPLKRVFRIVDALSKIKDAEIEWTHFGDGTQYHELKEYAAAKLGSNIKTSFPGDISNVELMQQYRNQEFHLFLNVSESEGLPVSIMEAISFGIPIIATNVGGTAEIVIHGVNGYLLQKDFTDSILTDDIMLFARMKDSEYLQFRKNARRIWKRDYNAENNYKKFYENLNEFFHF